jgi:hypothetical protein
MAGLNGIVICEWMFFHSQFYPFWQKIIYIQRWLCPMVKTGV